jgi:hypothetical protein
MYLCPADFAVVTRRKQTRGSNSESRANAIYNLVAQHYHQLLPSIIGTRGAMGISKRAFNSGQLVLWGKEGA